MSDRHDYISPTVSNDTFYNEDAACGADELLITEGIPDCISAHQAGVACISPATTIFRNQDVQKLLKLTQHVKRIIVCNDAEVKGAGDEGARKTSAILWSEGRDVRIAVIPRPDGVDKVDVNEFVATAGHEVLRVLLAQAMPYPNYLIDRILKETPKVELDRLLDPVLEAIAGSKPIVADAVLDEITTKFNVRRNAIKVKLKELSSKKKTFSKVEPSTDDIMKPIVQVGNRQLSEIVEDVRNIISGDNGIRIKNASGKPTQPENAPIFRQGKRLILLRQVTGAASVIDQLTEADVVGILARTARWITVSKSGDAVAVFPPKDVARDFLVYPPPVPQIDLVVRTPIFGANGNLIVAPGMHEEERLWLDNDAGLYVGTIPANPSEKDVSEARQYISEPFCDFPFEGDADRANLMAALLLPFMRRMVQGPTPLHVVEASSPGSGKGLICDVISVIATGHPCAPRTLSEFEDENRKAITAQLLQSPQIVLLDNVVGTKMVSSAALASALTAHIWTDRILGHSGIATLPISCLWLLTGNNLSMS